MVRSGGKAPNGEEVFFVGLTTEDIKPAYENARGLRINFKDLKNHYRILPDTMVLVVRPSQGDLMKIVEDKMFK